MFFRLTPVYRLPQSVCSLYLGVDASADDEVTAMNIIRMIKLFGWEPRVNDQVAEKREEELFYIGRFRILGLISRNVK